MTARLKKACFSILLSLCLCFPAAWIVTAQENYPVPPGDPEKWGFPGRSETIQPEQPSYGQSRQSSIAPAPQGDEDANRPNTPSGEAQEKYTGTRQFGNIAGTGITPFGTENRR